jgi:hypothetical protein
VSSVAFGTVLPSYAQPGQSFSNPRAIPVEPNGVEIGYMPDSAYLEQLQTLSFTLALAAIDASRAVTVYVRDEDGSRVWSAQATDVFTQNPTTYELLVAPNIGSSFTTAGLFSQIIVPETILYPGWTLSVVLTGYQTGDTFGAAYLVTTMIPTGDIGDASQATPTVLPTILLA